MLSILNVRSNTHNSCEDSVFVKESNEYVFGVVADGCSTGIKSHFASQAIAYIVENMLDAEVTKDSAVDEIKRELMSLQLNLILTPHHLLSTCLLFSYNKRTKQLRIRAFGDGEYYINDIEYLIDQNNIPDYIGYHLCDNNQQFLEYLKKYPEKTYYDVNRFMICSDGIGRIERSQFADSASVYPSLLFIPPGSSNFLERMWNKLKRDHYTLSDDLTIVSYVS